MLPSFRSCNYTEIICTKSCCRPGQMFGPQVGEPPTAPLSGPDVCGSAPGGRADEAVWQLFPKAAAEGAFLSAGPAEPAPPLSTSRSVPGLRVQTRWAPTRRARCAECAAYTPASNDAPGLASHLRGRPRRLARAARLSLLVSGRGCRRRR